MAIAIQPADVQDRDGALDVVDRAQAKYRELTKLWADGGYRDECVVRILEATGIELDIVTRPDDYASHVWVRDGEQPPPSSGFKVVKWRWIVERTFGWLGRYRRLSKDYEQSPASSLAWVRLALVWMLARRLGEIA